MDLAKYSAILQTQALSFEEKLGFILAWEMSDAPDALLEVAVNAHLSERTTRLREAMVKAQTDRLRKVTPSAPLGVAPAKSEKIERSTAPISDEEYEAQASKLRQQMAGAVANIDTDPHASANLELWGNRLTLLNRRRAAR